MLSLSRIGPLITAAETSELVELNSAEIPVDAIARMGGKFSGRAPAITALTAHCRTLYDHGGNAPCAGVILPITSSGLWLLPASISSTRSSVGMMIGRVSVIPLSR